MLNPAAESTGKTPEAHIERLLSQLTLEQKVRLVTGASMWESQAEPSIGLNPMVFSDGPAGVRGQIWDERDPSASVPSPTSLAASWDTGLIQSIGELIAAEARRKDVDVVLGPTVNLQRSPRGGRHFEALSEDPWLSGAMATSYIKGVQAHGVGTSPKHFVANDSETDRHSLNVQVNERTLREVYLAPFEAAVVDGGAWLVMSSYNAVNGVAMTENDLLTSPLKDEWGFDGVVVSDWSGVHDTVAAARAGQDLEMPGPNGVWGEQLVAAVRAGEVPESAVDEKVRRLLLLATRVGALEGYEKPAAVTFSAEQTATLLRTAAVEGTVLAKNTGVLPLDASRRPTVAVVGDHARSSRTQGGGSAKVFPPHVTTALDGIREAFGGEQVTFAPGVPIRDALQPLDAKVTRTEGVRGTGIRLRFFDIDGNAFVDEVRQQADFTWVGDAFLLDAAQIEVETTFVAPSTGRFELGFAGVGYFQFDIDGVTVNDEVFQPEGSDIFSAVFSPPKKTFPVELRDGQEVTLRLRHTPEFYPALPMLRFALSWDEPSGTHDEELSRAVSVASKADVAVVVVGTTEEIESEGKDRQTLQLPAGQDELVRQVIASNPRTVVVVNAGAPVTMPWLDDAAAVLLAWFPGQEFGSALADILTGVAEPGGRLPNTWPAVEQDVPVWKVEPEEGQLVYAEGINVGYREWHRRAALGGPRPALPFGHGLGYTSWSIADAKISRSGPSLSATATLTNIGDRTGKRVTQLYLSRSSESLISYPSIWLAGYSVDRLEAGSSCEVTVRVPLRALQHWDVDARAWTTEPGTYTVWLGTSVEDLADIGSFTVSA